MESVDVEYNEKTERTRVREKETEREREREKGGDRIVSASNKARENLVKVTSPRLP